MPLVNGTDFIDGQTKDYNDRLNSLKKFASEEKHRIIEIGKKLDECQEKLSPIEELVGRAKRTISDPLLFGDDVEKGQELLQKIEVN